MKKPIVIALPIAGLVLLGIYFSPHIALYQMKRAIDAKDAEAFSEYVDFPALRESFKGQMMAAMNEQMSSPEIKNNPFAGLGQAMAAAFIGPMIDSMVSPAGVIAMMNTGKPNTSSQPTSATADGQPSQTPNYSVSYKDWNRAVVRAGDSGDDKVGFVLKRQGLWNWRLSSVEMPASLMKR